QQDRNPDRDLQDAHAKGDDNFHDPGYLFIGLKRTTGLWLRLYNEHRAHLSDYMVQRRRTSYNAVAVMSSLVMMCPGSGRFETSGSLCKMKASHFRRLHRAILRFKNRRGSNRCLMKVSVAGQLASGELDTQQKRKKPTI
ncbi:hypothetical protein ACCT09_05495, partial [Rhizobium ruizarguesonis]